MTFKKLKLWYKFEGRYISQDFIQGIKNIIYWFPVIWKDRNWDSNYIFEILKYKLKAQAKYIGDRDIHTQAQLDAKRMRVCASLITKIQNEFYTMEYMDYIEEKFNFEPIEGRKGYNTLNLEIISQTLDDYFLKYPLIYKRVLKGEGIFNFKDKLNEWERKRTIAMNIGNINQERAYNLFFKIMKENILNWWD